MGMRGTLEQISSERLAEFIKNPRLAYKHIRASVTQHSDGMLQQAIAISSLNPEEFLDRTLAGLEGHPDLSEVQRAQIREQHKKQFGQVLSRLANAQAVPKPGPQLVKGPGETAPDESRKLFSLEKDWHILHYLLNGTAEGGTSALADVVLGGKEIPDLEGIMGYGPARYLLPEQVIAVAGALAKVDFAKLAARFDAEDAASKQIYGIPRRSTQDFAKLVQARQNNPAAKKRMEERNARIEARLAKMSAEEREQEIELARERKRQNIENFFNPQPIHFSVEDVEKFIRPVRDFYQQATDSGNAMLHYIT